MSKSLGNVIDPIEVIDGTGKDSLLRRVASGNLPQHEVNRYVLVCIDSTPSIIGQSMDNGDENCLGNNSVDNRVVMFTSGFGTGLPEILNATSLKAFLNVVPMPFDLPCVLIWNKSDRSI